MDGGPLGELEYETFNAAAAKITIKGNNIHPGSAKNKMVNSLKIAMELNALLPAEEAPEHTEGYEGFYHLLQMNGDVEETKLYYIIRDHDRDKFEGKKQHLTNIVEELNEKYDQGTLTLDLNDQYYNMKEKIEENIEVFEYAKEALERLDIEPKITPVRGGTDGAQLSYMGLPTPNIFAGGENMHGKFEYVSVETMEKATQVIIEIAKIYEEKA